MRDYTSDLSFAAVGVLFIIGGVGITYDMPLMTWIGSVGMLVASSVVAARIFARRRQEKRSAGSP